ncbi:MAG: hypothetical protein K2X48_05535 [Chitinophagaceae bacterium]|nr:hypothetical protein [Chitinophagaceae bacterium]
MIRLFIQKKIQSLQAQILRQAERNVDIYIDKGFLYPDSGYVERFLFFKLDSSGKKIEKRLFTDKNGKSDSLGFSKYNAQNIVVQWKDLFEQKKNYHTYTFIQPILFRTHGLSINRIESIPNVCIDSAFIFFDPVIKLPQINSQVYKPSH